MLLQNLLLVLVVIHGSYGKHFHGGSMSWKPISNGEQIEVTYRVGFKLDHSEPGFDACSADAQQMRTPLRGSGNLDCSRCSGDDYQKKMYWVCDAFDEQLDSSVGGDVVVYNVPTLPAGETKFDVSYATCCWIRELVSPDKKRGSRGWNMVTQVNVQYRPDIDGINSSPVTAPIPVEKFRGGCVYNLRIAASDPDDDLVLCRNMKQSECPPSGQDRACGTPTSGLKLKSDCTLTFDATVAGEGYHAANVIIRDCPNKKCKKPYSKVPLLFLLHVADSSTTCIKPTVIIPPSCNTVSPGDAFEMTILAEAGDPSLPISKITSYKPMGMDVTDLQSVPGNPNQKSITLNWTPTSEDVGDHTLCFSALDSDMFTSGYSCTFVKVTNTPPVNVDIHASTPAEGAEHALKFGEPWIIRFTGEIQPPTNTAYITITNAETNEELYQFKARNSDEITYTSNAIEINPLTDKFPVILGDNTIPFRINLDDGVALPADGGCPTAAAELNFDLKGNGDYVIRPEGSCPENSPQKDASQCEMLYKELVYGPGGVAVPTGQHLCCSCIEPVYRPDTGPPGPPAGPPGSG